MDWHTQRLPSLIHRIPSREINACILIPLTVLTFIGVVVVAPLLPPPQNRWVPAKWLDWWTLTRSWENENSQLKDHNLVLLLILWFFCMSQLIDTKSLTLYFTHAYLFWCFLIVFKLPFVSSDFTRLWSVTCRSLIDTANPSQHTQHLVVFKLCYRHLVMWLTAEWKLLLRVYLKKPHQRFVSHL